DALEADVLLQPHRLEDCLVLDLAQVGRADLALLVVFARLQQLLRAQQTADMVRAERWFRSAHRSFLPISISLISTKARAAQRAPRWVLSQCLRPGPCPGRPQI